MIKLKLIRLKVMAVIILPFYVCAQGTTTSSIQSNGAKQTSVSAISPSDLAKALAPDPDKIFPRDYVQPPYFFYEASADVAPVTIVAGGHQFQIPRNYLQYAVLDKGRADFGIFTFFPDFKGAMNTDLDRYKSKNRFKVENLIALHRNTQFASAYWCCIKGFIEDAKKNQTVDAGYGLIRIVFPSSSSDGIGHGTMFLHLASVPEDSTAMVCDMTGEGAHSLCTGNLDVAPGVPFEYQFPAELLPHWHEITMHIVKLFNDFQVEPKK